MFSSWITQETIKKPTTCIKFVRYTFPQALSSLYENDLYVRIKPLAQIYPGVQKIQLSKLNNKYHLAILIYVEDKCKLTYPYVYKKYNCNEDNNIFIIRGA